MNFEILRATALIFRERQKNMAAEGATQLSDSVHLVKSIVKTEAEAEKAFVFCIGQYALLEHQRQQHGPGATEGMGKVRRLSRIELNF